MTNPTAAPQADPAPDSPRASFRAGVASLLPIVLGVVPFGLVAGAAAVEIGIGVEGAVGFSTIVFAGASQLAAIGLLGQDAPVAIAVMTALVINLRMLMYAASLAPHVGRWPLRRRLGGAYLLTDQAYAVAILRFREGTDPHPFAYYLGAGLTMWIPWQLSTIGGALVGATIPDSIPLGFAIPLMFIALLRPALTDRPAIAAAVASGAIAVVAAPLPANLGMPLAALAGIVTGVVVAERSTTSTAHGDPADDGDSP